MMHYIISWTILHDPQVSTIITVSLSVRYQLVKMLTTLEPRGIFKGAQWLSGRVLDPRPRSCGFEPHRRHCVVSLSKTHLSLLSSGSTQENPSRHN